MKDRWVLLVYRMPREPSTPRIAIWRKLKQLGVAQLADGLVALPRDERTQEHLEWVAEAVVEAGGTATVWLGEPGSPRAERELARRLAVQRAAEYREVVAEASAALDADAVDARRVLQRLRRQLRRIRRRDYFPPTERDEAAATVARLAEMVASFSDAGNTQAAIR